MISKVYILQTEQTLPLSIDEAWEYFSSPKNLEKLTPPEIGFKILTCTSDNMIEGQIISYKVKVFPLVWLTWVSEITHVKKQEFFIDNQISGPYALWHHRHTFEPVEGGVCMKDEIHYALPFGIIGRIIHKLFIRAKLKRIFDYRYQMLEKKSW